MCERNRIVFLDVPKAKLRVFLFFLREKNLNKMKHITKNVVLRPFHSHQIIKGRGRFMAEFCGNGRVSQNVCLYTSTAIGQLPVSHIRDVVGL